MTYREVSDSASNIVGGSKACSTDHSHILDLYIQHYHLTISFSSFSFLFWREPGNDGLHLFNYSWMMDVGTYLPTRRLVLLTSP